MSTPLSLAGDVGLPFVREPASLGPSVAASGFHVGGDGAYVTREQLWKVFKKIDTDGSGKLNRHEVQALFTKMGVKATPQRISKVFDKIDDNSDGAIDFDEFEKVLRSASNSSDESSMFAGLISSQLPSIDFEVPNFFNRDSASHLQRPSSGGPKAASNSFEALSFSFGFGSTATATPNEPNAIGSSSENYRKTHTPTQRVADGRIGTSI